MNDVLHALIRVLEVCKVGYELSQLNTL